MKTSFNGTSSFFILVFILSQILSINASDSNGLGENIDWKTWSVGKSAAKETGKPLMVILHKSWCPACKSLKPKFAASSSIEKLSSQFVMVNAKEGEQPIDESKFNIDGQYIPRIIFLDSNANVLSEIINEDVNPQYKYYHMNAESIVNSMKKVIQLSSIKKKKDTDEL